MKKKNILLTTVIVIIILMLIPIPMRLKDGGSVKYKAILYEYVKLHRLSETSSTGYEDGWELMILGIRVGGKINTYVNTQTLKINLFDRNEMIKVAIDNYSQYNNYFEYTDKDTIDKIYNLFINLETNTKSKSPHPEQAEELYTITFFNDENMLIESDNDIFKAIIHVYKKDNKYYVEEQENGIYEISENTFNIIKNFTK